MRSGQQAHSIFGVSPVSRCGVCVAAHTHTHHIRTRFLYPPIHKVAPAALESIPAVHSHSLPVPPAVFCCAVPIPAVANTHAHSHTHIHTHTHTHTHTHGHAHIHNHSASTCTCASPLPPLSWGIQRVCRALLPLSLQQNCNSGLSRTPIVSPFRQLHISGISVYMSIYI